MNGRSAEIETDEQTERKGVWLNGITDYSNSNVISK